MSIFDEIESDQEKAELVIEKPAPKAKAAEEAPPAEVPPNGLTREEFEKVRRDIFRMWNPEPEETR
jgi:hypothetical protein